MMMSLLQSLKDKRYDIQSRLQLIRIQQRINYKRREGMSMMIMMNDE